jgi:hypothetical protein
MNHPPAPDVTEAIRRAAQTGDRTVVRHNGDTAAVVSLRDLERLAALDASQTAASVASNDSGSAADFLATLPAERSARVGAIMGRFAHVRTSSGGFARRKGDEIDREDAGWR